MKARGKSKSKSKSAHPAPDLGALLGNLQRGIRFKDAGDPQRKFQITIEHGRIKIELNASMGGILSAIETTLSADLMRRIAKVTQRPAPEGAAS